MFGFGKIKEEVATINNRFDGKTYKGIWNLGGKEVIGAYLRDGNNLFVTENGIYAIPKGTKKTQLKVLTDTEMMNLGVNADFINEYLEDMQKGYCVRFLQFNAL